MNIPYPQRKPNRLREFDYSSNRAYFVTICTQDRKNTLCHIVGDGSPVPKPYGTIAALYITAISDKFPQVHVDHFVVMPNHIHLLVRVCADECGRPLVAPTMSRVVKQLKGIVSKQVGDNIWQKSFHDHIIRNREDYEEHLRYIYENPLCWCYDELYTE